MLVPIQYHLVPLNRTLYYKVCGKGSRKPMSILTGVIVSDLHTGNLTAPIPPNFTRNDGTPIGQTALQKSLTDNLKGLADDPLWHRPDVLISLAEAIDGQNRKSMGVETWSTQPLDQVKAAETILRWFDAKQYYVLQGSGYHVSIDGLPAEEILARSLKAVQLGDGDYLSAIRFILNEFDFKIHFAHHMPTSQSDWYLTTPMAKEGIRIKLKEKHLGGHIDAIVRGHGHQWSAIEFGSQYLIACPTWKVPDAFLFKKSGEPNYDIGAVRFAIFDQPDDFGYKFRFQKKLFDIAEAAPKIVTPSVVGGLTVE